MYKKAAGLVAQRGYTNIMTFRGGIPEWVKKGYPLEKSGSKSNVSIQTILPNKLNAAINDVTILDIRTASLYSMGWIKGCVKIPLALLSEKYTEISKNKPVVVVDHAGKQVAIAARFLYEKGFKVKGLEGGLKSWVKAKLPLEK